jgi:hypothetical protein
MVMLQHSLSHKEHKHSHHHQCAIPQIVSSESENLGDEVKEDIPKERADRKRDETCENDRLMRGFEEQWTQSKEYKKWNGRGESNGSCRVEKDCQAHSLQRPIANLVMPSFQNEKHVERATLFLALFIVK